MIKMHPANSKRQIQNKHARVQHENQPYENWLGKTKAGQTQKLYLTNQYSNTEQDKPRACYHYQYFPLKKKSGASG